MELKFSTIDWISKTAPCKIIKKFKNRAKIHVSIDDIVDFNFLKIGEWVLVIGTEKKIDGMIYLNSYKRIS